MNRTVSVTSPEDNQRRDQEALAMLDALNIDTLPQSEWTGKHYDEPDPEDDEGDAPAPDEKADALFAELESKVRRVASSQGEREYHAPIGTPIVSRGRNKPVAVNKVSKIELRHTDTGPQVVQHVANGEHVTQHSTNVQAENHIDAILEDHPHVTSIHHTFREGTVRMSFAGDVYSGRNKIGTVEDGKGKAQDQMRAMLQEHQRQQAIGTWGLTTPRQRLDHSNLTPQQQGEYANHRGQGLSHRAAMTRIAQPKEGGSIMARRSQGAAGGGAAQNASADDSGDKWLFSESTIHNGHTVTVERKKGTNNHRVTVMWNRDNSVVHTSDGHSSVKRAKAKGVEVAQGKA